MRKRSPMGVEPGPFSPHLRSPALRASSPGVARARSRRHAADRHRTLFGGKALGHGDQGGRERASRRSACCSSATALAARRLEFLAERTGNALIFPALHDRTELARLLASADALVHGCEAETFCMVAAEARASGIPLIVPDRGAAADQPLAGAGAMYRAGNGRELAGRRSAASSIAAPSCSGMTAALHSNVRTMDEHFARTVRALRRRCAAPPRGCPAGARPGEARPAAPPPRSRDARIRSWPRLRRAPAGSARCSEARG